MSAAAAVAVSQTGSVHAGKRAGNAQHAAKGTAAKAVSAREIRFAADFFLVTARKAAQKISASALNS